ncbi:MAG: protein kinase [Sandaracinaceae bacterium]|nr:protein kinase [Sandaracinaceae bacterium]
MAELQGASVPERVIPFGKYLLVDRIAVGGMAEVYTAKAFGAEGFEKIVAIKRILPTMAEDPEFIQMFIDEAKIAGQLTHPNIVPIYELGKIGDSHYIAMEYVWGKDLLQVMNRFRKMRKLMPPSMAAWIAAKMCEALDYAHRKKDKQGRSLNIIHRDVSPQNCLISYEGHVKMIDFGIAKAASRSTHTQAGVLKGKFGYMSPEQVRGLPIDHRSDIFAVGTCLYEMLATERLFVGESDFSTLEKVRNAQVPPLSLRVPDIPKELEEIVMKALARDVEQRWQSAGEMQEALQRFIAKEKPPFGTSKLAAWMRTAFAAEMAKEKQRLEAIAKMGPPQAFVSSMPSPSTSDEGEELAGEATVMTPSPFELQEGGESKMGALEQQPTQIFFSLEELEEREPHPSPSSFSSSSPEPSPAPFHGTRPAPFPPPGGGRRTGGFPAVGAAVSGPQVAQALSAPESVNPSGAVPLVEPFGAVPQAETPATSDAPAETRHVELPSGVSKKLPLSILLMGAAAVFGIAMVGVAWFFISAPSSGVVEVRISPSEASAASVWVNGQSKGKAPLRLEMEPGEYTIRVSHPGFQELERKVNLTPKAVVFLDLTLLPQPSPAAQAPPGAEALPSQASPPQAAGSAPASEASPSAQEPSLPGGTGGGSKEVSQKVASGQEGKGVSSIKPSQPQPSGPPQMQATRSSPPPRGAEPASFALSSQTPARAPQKIEPPLRPPPPRKLEPAQASATPTPASTQQRPAASSGQGMLQIQTLPWARVFIDGRDTGRNTPLRDFRVSSGRHIVGLRTPDGRMIEIPVDVPPNETVRIVRQL